MRDVFPAPNNKRVILCVLDGLGIGGARDAESFGDVGANTLGHIAEVFFGGNGGDCGQKTALILPHLDRLGLARAAKLACGSAPAGLNDQAALEGLWGCADEISPGKDTPSGHWEIAGAPNLVKWHQFPLKTPCFPKELTDALIERAGLPGILGNRHASGTQIIEELGGEHCQSGAPICYTSNDSVLQIAAHEEYFGLERLYDVCRLARELCDQLNVGRVIARPFIGDAPASFARTANRRDYGVAPPFPTLLDLLAAQNRQTVSIGKIADIFFHRATGHHITADGNDALFDALLSAVKAGEGSDLIFVNFVDFDMRYGHRRDPMGFGHALEAFDRRLPELYSLMRRQDLLILTADHGCDPTWQGSDHTRERIPILCKGEMIAPGAMGCRASFADIGASIAAYLNLPPKLAGMSFLPESET